jgi:hypothetical protein
VRLDGSGWSLTLRELAEREEPPRLLHVMREGFLMGDGASEPLTRSVELQEELEHARGKRWTAEATELSSDRGSRVPGSCPDAQANVHDGTVAEHLGQIVGKVATETAERGYSEPGTDVRDAVFQVGRESLGTGFGRRPGSRHWGHVVFKLSERLTVQGTETIRVVALSAWASVRRWLVRHVDPSRDSW